MFARTLRELAERIARVNAIDAHARIGADCWISGSKLAGKVNVGDNCRIFRAHVEGDVDIARFTSLWGPELFVLGRRHGVRIGSFCSIARFASIQEDNHNPQRTTTYFVERNILGRPDQPDALVSRGLIVIGHDVWIGAAAQIHSGVSVGTGAVIAGGAIVTRDVEPYAIVAGNPARVVRKRFDDATIARLLDEQWWNWSLDRLRRDKDYLLAIHGKPT